jgi:hypothetical protein
MRDLEATPDCRDEWAQAILPDESVDVELIDGIATRSGATAKELDGQKLFKYRSKECASSRLATQRVPSI